MQRFLKISLAFLAFLAALSWSPAGAAPSEKLLALVIGNASYKAKTLATPANDAALIAQTLQAAGFDVMGVRDLDGDGANAPVQFDTIMVQANHTYNASLLILDESKTPADTTSQQIANESNDHQFFYHTETINANFVYEDHDSHTPPMPVGLLTKWHIGSSTGNGKVHIILKHQPGIKDGNETTGEVDLDVNFNAIIE